MLIKNIAGDAGPGGVKHARQQQNGQNASGFAEHPQAAPARRRRDAPAGRAPRFAFRRILARTGASRFVAVGILAGSGAPRGIQVDEGSAHRLAPPVRFQVVHQLAGGGITQVRIRRQGLDEDAAQRLGTGVRRGRRRHPRANHALQPLGGVRLVRLKARHHFIQHHRHRPQVRIHADLAQVQPLRRSVRHAAELVAGQPPRKRERLGDSEVQHPHVSARIDPDVLRLDIAVNDSVKLLAFDLYRELVRVLQGLGHARGHFGRELGSKASTPCEFRKVLAVDILHRDIEETIDVAAVVDADHPGVDRRQFGLQLRSAPLGLDGIASVGVRAVLDQLQGQHLAVFAVLGQVHVGHPAAAQLLADLVLPELPAGRCDHLPLPRVPLP